jgi:hypothetical protein
MLHLSRALLFGFALAGLLYASTVDGPSTLIVAILSSMTVLAFLRAVSSEYDEHNPRPDPPKPSIWSGDTVHQGDPGETVTIQRKFD